MAIAYGFGHGMGMGFGLGFLNFLGFVLFVMMVGFAIRWLARGGRRWGGCRSGAWQTLGPRGPRHGPRGSNTSADRALATARERLARGEIDAAAFEALKQALSDEDREAPTTPYGAWQGPWHGPSHGQREDPLTTARMRLAQGELTVEEFETIRAALQA